MMEKGDRMNRRIISLLLSCALLLTVMPTAAAAGSDWEISDAGVEFPKSLIWTTAPGAWVTALPARATIM